MGKRANGEGSIYRRSDQRWVGSVVLDRGRRKSFYGKTRREVATKLAAALKARQDGLPIPSERHTVERFLRQWLEGKTSSVRPTTWARYESLIRKHLTPEIGRIALARLTPDRLQRLWSEKQAAGLSPASVRQMRALLRKALNDAERWGTVPRNVAALTSSPQVERREMLVLSPAEVRKLLDTAAEDHFEALYVLAVSTGLRQGELLALRWQDVDLDANTLQVRQTLHRTQGEFVFSPPKSSKSRRLVALTAAATAALYRRAVRQAEERQRAGAVWQDGGLIFTNEIGGPVDAGNLRRRSFWPLLERAGLPRIRFHDLRHTAATLMLGRGIHPKIVSEMLGHSQIGITLDLYSHVTPTMQRDAAEEMDRVLAGS